MATNLLSQDQGAIILAAAPSAEPVELLQYWRGLHKYKWWLVGFAGVCAIAAAIAVSFMTPIYRATVTLMIEQGQAKLVSIEEVYSGVSPHREHYLTQAEVLKAPALANKVIEKLQLERHAEFDPRQRKPGPLSTIVPGVADVDPSAWTSENVQAAVLTEFLRRVTIEPIRLTQLVRVGFDAADPDLAARVANTIAETYIEADVALRARFQERATDWLAGRLTDLKGNLEGSERALQQFREQEGLPDTKGLAQSGAVKQIEDSGRALNEATQRRIEAETNRRQVEQTPANPASLPLILQHPVVERLRDLESQAEKRLAEVSQRYGEEHPRLIAARMELAQARKNTRRGIGSVIASHQKEYQIAAATERASEKALASAKGSVMHMNRKEFQLEALEQDLTTNREIYNKFMNRYRETRAASDTVTSVVARVVDPAVRPGRPYKPRKEHIVLGGAIFGLLLGAIVALLAERLNSTLKSGDDVEAKLGVPTLAVVPLLTGDVAKAAGRHYLEEPNSVFSEAIRTARTSILLSSIDAQSKVLLVTSSVPAEGKSAFAINLALAHAQTKKTLLIEADLRRPSISRQLGLDESKPGLTSLFAGDANFSECVQRVEGSSLYVLPSGPVPENPLEILSSERFQQLIERVSAACDVVILDSPPVHLVSDSIVLSTMTTGVIFVVKADNTPYPLARRCIKLLNQAGATIVGVALNQLDFQKADRYYGAYTGYSKEYGTYYGKAA